MISTSDESDEGDEMLRDVLNLIKCRVRRCRDNKEYTNRLVDLNSYYLQKVH